MKKAFTLLELLIVTVVIAVLASITFRLIGSQDDASKRNMTIKRLQCLENACVGYFAAFGSYPPVRVVGSRNLYYEVDPDSMIQQMYDGNTADANLQEPPKSFNGKRAFENQCEAACRSQPLGMVFPFSEVDADAIGTAFANAKKFHDEGDKNYGQPVAICGGHIQNLGQLNHEVADWCRMQLFRFGLMSFLLPRYLLMMDYSDSETDIYDQFKQWDEHKSAPCRFRNGVPYNDGGDNGWQELAESVVTPDIKYGHTGSGDPLTGKFSRYNDKYWEAALLPSQIVTTRWIANFEEILKFQSPSRNAFKVNKKKTAIVYGVNLHGQEDVDLSDYTTDGFTIPNNFPNKRIPFYYPGGGQHGGAKGGGGGGAYVLDGITCSDAWGYEFYYYSPQPYQFCRLWSAGKDGSTFPPWITDDEIERLGGDYSRLAREFVADDLVHLCN